MHVASPGGHARGRYKFSRNAVELHLRTRMDALERWLLRDYNVRIDLVDPAAQALRGGMSPRATLLIGQWITSKELLDDLIDNVVRT